MPAALPAPLPLAHRRRPAWLAGLSLLAARWARRLPRAAALVLLPLAAVAAAAAAPGRAAPPRSAEVPMRLPDTVQPQAYQLHLRVDPAQPRHSGEVLIDLRLRQPVAAQGTLRLHAKDLVIGAAWLEIGARRLAGQVRRVDAERIDLRFGRVLPAGPARLGLAFSGTLQTQDMDGLFRQREAGNSGQWLAFTQFQATGARLAFPLFDEPGWKVPWTLSLTVPDHLQAVSNMPVRAEAPAGPGHKRVDFEPTPPLPSYLLAWAVGEVDLLDGGTLGADPALPLRFITPRGRAAEAGFAARNTGPVLQRLEAWFGLPYPYAKLDSLAIPVPADFGAMEHAGLITYAAGLMLATPAEQTPAFERRYLAIAAHELAHQWFGNLVTMAWWDDLWLNESFASWLGDKVTADLLPDSSTSRARLVQARARAMHADRLVGARRIAQPVQNDEDMAQLWDAITYEKGQSVLAMFEAWLGPERFQAGVRRYIQRHAWGLATSADFFNALAVDDPTLPAALRSFTHQPGIPRLGVTLLCGDGPPRLRLTQSRLLPLGSPAPAPDTRAGSHGAARWQLPLRLRTPAGESRLLLTEPEATLALPDTDCPAWVQANADGTGYYRAAYAGDGLARLAAAPGLPPGEILALLDDARGLHDAGDLDSAGLLALVARFAGHPDAPVAHAALAALLHLRPLVGPAQRGAYAARWQADFGARGRRLGWLPRPDDSDDDRQLRPRLLPLLADLGDDTALQAQALALARAWLADHGTLPADLRAAALATAARGADEPLFNALLAALRSSAERPERHDLLAALGQVQAPGLARRARTLLLDPDIDPRESLGPLLGAQADDPVLRADALAFVAQHLAELAKRLGREPPARLPGYFSSACSADEAGQIQRSFGPTAARFPGGSAVLARTLAAVRLCSHWRAQQASGL